MLRLREVIVPAEQVADAGRTEDLSQQARDSSSAWHSPHVAKSHCQAGRTPDHRGILCPGPAALSASCAICLRAHSPPSPPAQYPQLDHIHHLSYTFLRNLFHQNCASVALWRGVVWGQTRVSG